MHRIIIVQDDRAGARLYVHVCVMYVFAPYRHQTIRSDCMHTPVPFVDLTAVDVLQATSTKGTLRGARGTEVSQSGRRMNGRMMDVEWFRFREVPKSSEGVRRVTVVAAA